MGVIDKIEYLAGPPILNTETVLPNRGIISEYPQVYESLRSRIQRASIPSKTEPWLHTKAFQVFVITLLNAVGRVYSRGTLLCSLNLFAISLRLNRSYSSYGISKFFKKKQS